MSTTMPKPEIHRPSYEVGYAEGESSGYADWLIALDRLPFDVHEPKDVIDAVNRLMAENMELKSRLRGLTE